MEPTTGNTMLLRHFLGIVLLVFFILVGMRQNLVTSSTFSERPLAESADSTMRYIKSYVKQEAQRSILPSHSLQRVDYVVDVVTNPSSQFYYHATIESSAWGYEAGFIVKKRYLTFTQKGILANRYEVVDKRILPGF